MTAVSAPRAVYLMLLLLGSVAFAPVAAAEDGYDLWLRYRPLEQSLASRYRSALTQLVVAGDSATLRVARAELDRGLRGLLGAEPAAADGVSRDGALVVGTPRSLPLLAQLGVDLPQPGSQGYVIRSATLAGRHAVVAPVAPGFNVRSAATAA